MTGTQPTGFLPRPCQNPGHGGETTCAACARACEAELSALNDRYMRMLRERRQWEADTRAALKRSAEDAMNAFGLWQIGHALDQLARPLREVAGRAAMITPDMALAAHRAQVADFQRAAAENLRDFDEAQHTAARDAARVWAAWRAESKWLREVIARAGSQIHQAAPTPDDGPCRCRGCELVRAIDRVPATPEAGGLPAPDDSTAR